MYMPPDPPPWSLHAAGLGWPRPWAAAASPPPRPGPRVDAPRRHHGVGWPAVRPPRAPPADGRRRGPPAIPGGAGGGAARLVPRWTQAALRLARVEAAVALAAWASRRAREMGAAYRWGGPGDASWRCGRACQEASPGPPLC